MYLNTCKALPFKVSVKYPLHHDHISLPVARHTAVKRIRKDVDTDGPISRGCQVGIGFE
jgi:hypothetical protein